MKLINLDDPTFGLGLEKEAVLEELLDSQGVFGRFAWKMMGCMIKRVGFMPTMYFEREDVDEDVVRELMKYPDYLHAVMHWVENGDYKQVEQIRQAKKVFDRIYHPKKRDSLLYRGFSLGGGQQNLGLTDEALSTMNPGEEFTFLPDKLLSFSQYREITKSYGNVIVTIDCEREDNRVFHISNEVLVAAFMEQSTDKVFRNEYRYFSYFESVFLPDGQPLKFKLLHK